MGMNQKLRDARMRKHWSQTKAAAACNVDVQTFYRWEHGLQIPRGDSLDLLCRIFDCTEEDLGFGYPTISKEQQSQQASKSTETSMPVILLTSQQTTAFNDLLNLGDEMDTISLSKRKALAKLFQSQQNKPFGTSIEPTILTATLSRRHALAAIIGTTATALGLAQDIGYPQLHEEEILLLCSSNIPLCWTLYFEGGLNETKEHITSYIQQLSQLASRSTRSRKQAAGLASQAYQLSALIEILQHNLGTALQHAKKSVEFAHVTDDFNLQTAASIRLAVVYSNMRPQQRLAAYQQALQFSEPTSPLLQARVYAGLAETYSALRDEKSARHYLDLVSKTAPTHYQADPNFSYSHFDPWSIHMYEKDVWVNLGRTEEAWKTLEKAHLAVEQEMTVNRVDLTMKQAEIAILLGNLEEGYAYLTRAIEGATTLESQLLLENAYSIYINIRKMWPNEQNILQQLEERFQA
jgi:transcriptional regulator with XRE-family HTH domain/tetratricopeptide (TPR) repeat protein